MISEGNALLLGEPPQTQYDLHFQVAGIPVRVHPLFWVVGLILGATDRNPSTGIFIWVGVVFVSILVHELGHAFVMRYYGYSPRVVLYMMGGLAIPDSSPWSIGASSGRRTPFSQIIISAAGPGAGFGLALFTVAFIYVGGGALDLYASLPVFWGVRFDEGPLAGNAALLQMVSVLLWVNIFWGLMNLAPVYPLDGGQIARELFVINDPWKGVVRSLWLSVIAGGVCAVLGLSSGRIFLPILFASLAVSSYLAIQQMSGGGGYGGGGYGGGGLRGGRGW